MKSQLGKVVLVAAVLVIISWGIFWGWDLRIAEDAQRGQFGDKFGALNALFTGLALVGLIAAFWHQREESDQREAETLKLMRQMERTAAALETQTKMETKTRYLNALVARIEGFTLQFEIYGKSKDSVGQQNQLLHELHRELNSLRAEAGVQEFTREQVEAWEKSQRP